jgi:hypothetical protein
MSEDVVMEKHVCDYQPSKRGNFVACKCGERFPCADKDCGHVSCWDERGTMPVCHFCGDKLKGEHNTESATWGVMNVRNHTRSAHYCCRDAYSKTSRRDIACRAKGPNAYYPEACSHEFEGKKQLTVDDAKLLAGSYAHE